MAHDFASPNYCARPPPLRPLLSALAVGRASGPRTQMTVLVPSIDEETLREPASGAGTPRPE